MNAGIKIAHHSQLSEVFQYYIHYFFQLMEIIGTSGQEIREVLDASAILDNESLNIINVTY